MTGLHFFIGRAATVYRFAASGLAIAIAIAIAIVPITVTIRVLHQRRDWPDNHEQQTDEQVLFSSGPYGITVRVQ